MNQNNTAQAAKHQTVLSFDERERILCQYIREPINHDRGMAIAIETAVLSKLRAPVADERQALEHVANEWADMACNAISWVRNIKDGISTPEKALENLMVNVKHCREVHACAGVRASAPVADPYPARLLHERDNSLAERVDSWHQRNPTAALASAPVAGEAFKDECVATGETCDYGPYGPDLETQCKYCGAAPNYDAAPQPSAEYERGHADGWAAGWDQAIKQPQADKDGAEQALKDLVTHGMSIQRVAPADFLADRQQRAGDVDVGRLLNAAKGMTKLYGHVWDRTDGALVVFPENVARFDAAFDALRAAVGEVVDDAT
ncbi:hypothetical protein HGQ98_00490 [Achromobacter ruhlandii]|uniref:Uncharacterized protein n=1 Tax=Achromobacter ruhlandii TaxID=72557 RepID=A0A848NBB0_9BURK|nr:hypothetical protein [Achromobacter ruhlandii]NMU88367.1 hypothetical protein [Achromobacter ruhlandii]